MNAIATFTIDTPVVKLVARLAPWDMESFGFGVAQIDVLECRERAMPATAMLPFFQWLDASDIRLVSCRLKYDRLIESMLLEDCGFRFIETVLHPYVDLSRFDRPEHETFVITPAECADIAALEVIAAEAFVHGRIHMDPRLGPELGGAALRPLGQVKS